MDVDGHISGTCFVWVGWTWEDVENDDKLNECLMVGAWNMNADVMWVKLPFEVISKRKVRWSAVTRQEAPDIACMLGGIWLWPSNCKDQNIPIHQKSLPSHIINLQSQPVLLSSCPLAKARSLFTFLRAPWRIPDIRLLRTSSLMLRMVVW